MTTTGRSADSRRIRRGPAQWLLGLLLALAIGASIAMMFSHSRSIAASLAVIAALWAAVIGAILVTKFRRQADSAESKARDLRLVYELQLEREITARRQYELGVETQIRKEVRAETNEELGELKAQVQALRASLELLVGGDLPEQRAALRSERRRELEYARSRSGDSAYPSADGNFAPADASYDDGAAAERDFASTAPETNVAQVPVAEPNSMTEVIPVVTEDARIVEPSDDEPRGRRATGTSSRHGAAATPTAATPTAATPTDVPMFVDENPTDEWAVAAAEVVPDLSADEAPVVDVAPVAGPTSPGGAAPVAQPPYIGGRHGRSADATTTQDTPRAPEPAPEVDPEAGAHEAGRSVTELMEQLRAGAGGGRRRRRED